MDRQVPPGTEVFPQTTIHAAPADYEPTACAALLDLAEDRAVAAESRLTMLHAYCAIARERMGEHEWAHVEAGVHGVPFEDAKRVLAERREPRSLPETWIGTPEARVIGDALERAGYPSPPGHSAYNWVAPIALAALAAVDAVSPPLPEGALSSDEVAEIARTFEFDEDVKSQIIMRLVADLRTARRA